MLFHSLYDTLRPKIFLVGLCLSQDKVLAWFKTIGDMFILTNISHLIANDPCAIYLSIDVGVRVPINPSVNATVSYKFAQISSKCTIQNRTLMMRGNHF